MARSYADTWLAGLYAQRRQLLDDMKARGLRRIYSMNAGLSTAEWAANVKLEGLNRSINETRGVVEAARLPVPPRLRCGMCRSRGRSSARVATTQLADTPLCADCAAFEAEISARVAADFR